jgi:replicative DNA helicase
MAGYNIEQLGDLYIQYVKDRQVRRVGTGYEFIDEPIRGLSPGEVLGIICRTGVGKTAFALNIAARASRAGLWVLIYSLEMPAPQIYERLVQMDQQISGTDVERAYVEGVGSCEILRTSVEERLDGISVVDVPRMSVDDIIECGQYFTEHDPGMRPHLLLIDYLGLVRPGMVTGSLYYQVTEVALEMRRVAKELRVPIIVLHQVSREGGEGSTPITLDMARDSGQIEESVDFLLGMWKPKELNTERYRTVALLKNRRGPLLKKTLSFNCETLEMLELGGTGA